MADTDMLDTDYLFQPRRQGTGWCFRMMPPHVLIGRTNPRTGRPYGREIREGPDTRELKQARKLRDLRLGKELEHYREEQAKVAQWLKEKGYLG